MTNGDWLLTPHLKRIIPQASHVAIPILVLACLGIIIRLPGCLVGILVLSSREQESDKETKVMWQSVLVSLTVAVMGNVFSGLFGGGGESRECENLRRRISALEADAEHNRGTQQLLEEMKEQLREMQQRESKQREILEELGYNSDEPRITTDLITTAREEFGYVEGKLNIVFVGNVNVGKSSLVNALCGKLNKDADAARVGGNQVTLATGRYESRHHPDIVLFDTPGAGTMDVPAFRFYYEQQLFAFDVVVLVHDTTLTMADIRVLQICSLAQQPCVAVRTRADSHIRNYATDYECGLEEAREMYLAEARQDILESQAKITKKWPEHGITIRDHIVSATGVRNILEGAASSDDPAFAYIDEWDFVCALSLRRMAPLIANAPE